MLAQANVYGGTHELVHNEFPALGISHTLVDPFNSSVWKEALKPNTKVSPQRVPFEALQTAHACNVIFDLH